jgi:hypothetical protein
MQVTVYLYPWLPPEFRPFGSAVIVDFPSIQREANRLSGCDIVIE